MTSNQGGPANDPDGVPSPTRDDRGRDPGAIAGKAAATGDEPPGSDRDSSEAATDEQAAIDLDLARDRAS